MTVVCWEISRADELMSPMPEMNVCGPGVRINVVGSELRTGSQQIYVCIGNFVSVKNFAG